MTSDEPTDDELLAAELAFGLLDPVEREQAERRLTEAGFAVLHERWRMRAAEWLSGHDVIPPDNIWAAIQGGLPANSNKLVRQVRRWRLLALLAGGAAACLGVVTLEQHSRIRTPSLPPPVIVQQPNTPPLLAILRSKTSDDVFTISYDRSRTRITAAASKVEIGRLSAELWIIPADGRPRALGLIAGEGTSAVAAPPSLAPVIAAGATLAVSAEPKGGSPTGLPTGPIIASGTLLPT